MVNASYQPLIFNSNLNSHIKPSVISSNLCTTFRRLVMSDLHLGSSYCNEADILNTLETETFDQLILAGDIIDFQRIPKFTKTSLKIFECISSINDVIYIIGNHDNAFDKFSNSQLLNIKFCDQYEFVDNNKRFKVEHGNNFDCNIINCVFFMNILCVFANLIENLFKINLHNLNFFKPNLNLKKIFQKNSHIDTIIMGHFHCPEISITEINNKIYTYANCGDFVKNSSYLIIEDGVVSLKYVSST